MKTKKNRKENYLDRFPCRREGLEWKLDEEGRVTLEKENRGFFNRLFQLLLHKPRVSYIHLDEMGSFLWPKLDGTLSVLELGEPVRERFGEKAEPLYERLCRYVEILHSYGFVDFH
ncbi:MAG: PqqD family protein [Clostridia bacterium]|nr:PqqD family protein [Clostridia bacterium]